MGGLPGTVLSGGRVSGAAHYYLLWRTTTYYGALLLTMAHSYLLPWLSTSAPYSLLWLFSGVAPLLGAHRPRSADRTSASVSEGGGEGEAGHDMTRSYDASPYGATTLQRAIGTGNYHP